MENDFEQHWKIFALFFKNVANERNINEDKLAKMIGVNQSTINRFFNLKFCLRFDYVLKIIHALELNMFFKVEDDETELNRSFELAMEELGRRKNQLSKN